MNYLKEIEIEISQSINVKQSVRGDKIILFQIQEIVIKCLKALKNNNKIIFAGNGGSFSDAQHLSTEFVSRFRLERNSLPSIALGSNGSSMSAIGNDYGYENIFSRELEGIAQKGDFFIPISTSGNSQNILNAVQFANNIQIDTFSLTGQTGGGLINLCKSICVPSDDVARIQECHIMIGHIICNLVEQEYFKKNE